MQKLEVFQSLWAMTRRPWQDDEMSLAEMMAKITAADFDGVDIVYGDYPQAELSALLAEHRLACTVTAFPDSVESLAPALDLALALDARHINIIGAVYPFSVEEGAEYLRGWLAMCAAANMPVTIETHRDCITTDLLYTLQLMDAVPEMNLCADLSHFVVGREFKWPITPKYSHKSKRCSTAPRVSRAAWPHANKSSYRSALRTIGTGSTSSPPGGLTAFDPGASTAPMMPYSISCANSARENTPSPAPTAKNCRIVGRRL